MSEQAQSFVEHLQELASRDTGAMAALRRSLGFAPGAYASAYPHVERFVGGDRHAEDPYRKALYVVAGLFAAHPQHAAGQSFASAFGAVGYARESASIEQRFVALLGAGSENVHTYLRQATSLIAADGRPVDYVKLLDDLARWFNPFAHEARDALRQKWARDFYRTYDHQGTASEQESQEQSK